MNCNHAPKRIVTSHSLANGATFIVRRDICTRCNMQLLKQIDTMEALGLCQFCHQPVPTNNIDGTLCREGREYKQVLGDPLTLWHHIHPLFPDCFRLESEDPDSVWYDNPRRFIQDPMKPAFFEELDQ